MRSRLSNLRLDGDSIELENTRLLIRQLRRLLARSRSRPIALLLRGGYRVELGEDDHVSVRRAIGTIEIAKHGGAFRVPADELLAIELCPRSRRQLESMRNDGPQARS